MVNKLNCLIVDDEEPAHLVLKAHLTHCDDLAFGASAYNGMEALTMLRQHSFDLVFLDIDMPLVNGLEVIQTLPHRPATIITTAYASFAFQAYQHDAVDYLLKPISLPRFLKAVDKARVFHLATHARDRRSTTIELRVEGAEQAVLVSEIVCFESIGNYVKVVLVDKRVLVAYDSLKGILSRLPEELFVQAHKSYVVNRTHIISQEPGTVVLLNEIRVPVGRKYGVLLEHL